LSSLVSDDGLQSLRALIDQDFADRFVRILKDTPAGSGPPRCPGCMS